MNWKALCLIASLGLTISLTACSSSPASNNQISPDASPAMSKDKAGDAMSHDNMGKDKAGGAMSHDNMSKDKAGDAMSHDNMSKDKAGDAMKQSPAPSNP
ncbi:MAG: hypothetical protein V7K47_03940 [Nostoc sp.]